jgi:hypothetical protein
MTEVAVTPSAAGSEVSAERSHSYVPGAVLLGATLLAMAGATLDYRFARSARAEMQLATERSLQLTAQMAASLPPGALKLMAIRSFRVNFDHPEMQRLSVQAGYDPTSGIVSIRTSAAMPTKALRFLGWSSMDLTAAAAVMLPGSQPPG